MCATGGYHHSWGTVAGDTVSTAGTGAAIGTAIAPGIGTAIGAGAGALAGFLTGLFTGDSPDELAPPAPPPPPPDLADEIAKRGDIARQARLMASGAGNFLTGPLGDTSKAPAVGAGLR